jgi:TolB-like protein/DNA-binding SARP family transcriptional activator
MLLGAMSMGRLQVHLVGPVRLLQNGKTIALPRSRKVLVLLAYLALEGEQSRSRLCDLFWDGPNDPRGELRWCLSKLRALVDTSERRVVTSDNTLVGLDLSEVLLDARQIESLVRAGLAQASDAQLADALALFRGDVLEGLELDGSPELSSWLAARRQGFRTLRVALASELGLRPAGAEESLQRIQAWLEVAPFEPRAHQALLELLSNARRFGECDTHLARTIRAFEREGLDWAPLRDWWRQLARVSAPATQKDMPVLATAPRERDAPAPLESRHGGRVSVAIMPFEPAAASSGAGSQHWHGLSDDIITRLAKLRALFVIARGTSHTLGERGIDARAAGHILGVRYVVSGRVRRHGERTRVNVELAETHEARIIWADELDCDGEATFVALDAIVDRIVAAVAKEIELAECQRALQRPPSSLDAWEAYHRGLWHMYKFRPLDNREAEQLFRQAIGLDPSFARAHAGLSFTQFQNVFLELTPDREVQMDLAFESAAHSLEADDRDPAAHWAMGRALWLRGSQRESVQELERSIELSPNFALGHYTLGFVEAQSGDPRTAIRASNTSRALSPFDPLQFGMFGSCALAHLRLGELEEANQSALAAISRPNAHVHILAIAVCTLALTQRHDEARKLVATIRANQSYDIERFLRCFRLDRDAELLIRHGARAIGF